MIAKKLTENIFNVPLFGEEDKDYRQLKLETIKEKNTFAKGNKQFSLNDFALVRTTSLGGFPSDMFHKPPFYLFPHPNPVKSILDCIKYKIDRYKDIDLGVPAGNIDSDKTKLLCPNWRSTIHYALNHLASDAPGILWTSSVFSNKDIIIIEPLIEKINSVSVLNPVDTFFDVSKQNLPVSENAVFMLTKSIHTKLMEQKNVSDELNKRKIFVFDKEQDRTILTEFILKKLGYQPLKSRWQSQLICDMQIKDGETVEENKAYLEKLHEFIEQTCVGRNLHRHIEIPQVQRERRGKDSKTLLGTFHQETKWYDKDEAVNEALMQNTYADFMNNFLPPDADAHDVLRLRRIMRQQVHENCESAPLFSDYSNAIYHSGLEPFVIEAMKTKGYAGILDAVEKTNNASHKLSKGSNKKLSHRSICTENILHLAEPSCDSESVPNTPQVKTEKD